MHGMTVYLPSELELEELSSLELEDALGATACLALGRNVGLKSSSSELDELSFFDLLCTTPESELELERLLLDIKKLRTGGEKTCTMIKFCNCNSIMSWLQTALFLQLNFTNNFVNIRIRGHMS